jgi:hypothetical protein
MGSLLGRCFDIWPPLNRTSIFRSPDPAAPQRSSQIGVFAVSTEPTSNGNNWLIIIYNSNNNNHNDNDNDNDNNTTNNNNDSNNNMIGG